MACVRPELGLYRDLVEIEVLSIGVFVSYGSKCLNLTGPDMQTYIS